jgi:predicted nucleotidyltransferase
MKRDRATELLEGLLRRVSKGAGWPLEVVESVRVFGSYARGALEPGDVDVAVDLNRQHTRWGHTWPNLLLARDATPTPS